VLSPATVRRAGEILGHARVEIVPGAPHSMYWETPALFNDAVGRFLADVTAAGVTRVVDMQRSSRFGPSFPRAWSAERLE